MEGLSGVRMICLAMAVAVAAGCFLLVLPAGADVGALVESGRQHFEAGEYEAAAADFSEALKEDDSSAEALCGLGATYLQQGQLTEARPLLLRAVEANPHLAAAHIDLGAYWMETGQPQKAAAEFEAATEIDADSTAAAFNLGSAYLRLSKWVDAITSFSAAYRKGMQTGDVHYGLSIAYVNTGNFTEAARQLESAVVKDPQSVVYWVALARVYVAMKEPQKAVGALHRALALDPRSQVAWEELPGALQASGDPATVLKQLSDRAESSPDDFLTQCEAGLLAVNLQRYDVAEKCLQRAVELDPKNPVAQSGLGWTYVLADKWQDAIAPLSSAAELLPDDVPVRVNLALAYYHADQLDQYEEALRDVLRLDKYNYEAAMSLGNLLSDQSKWEDAARAYERAASGKQTAEAFQRAGECRLAAGQAKEAIPLLNGAAGLDKANPEIYFSLGRAQEAAGEVKAARAAYEKVLALSPNHAGAKERLAALPAS